MNAAQEVSVNLRVIRDLAATQAPLNAIRAIAQTHERNVKVLLGLKTHAPGTRTPSAPGEPPALISGHLRRTVTHTARAGGPGIAVAAVWADAEYAPIQEKGGKITAKRYPQLGNPRVGFFGPQVVLPARPFMAKAIEDALASGDLTTAAAAAFAATLGL